MCVYSPAKNLEFYVNMYFSDERGVMRGEVSCFLVREAFAQRRTPLQGATSSHSARGRPTGQSRRESRTSGTVFFCGKPCFWPVPPSTSLTRIWCSACKQVTTVSHK